MGELIRKAFHLDVAGLVVAPALRATLGVLVLLVAGLATGQATLGVAAAGGAIGLGTVSLTGTYRGKLHAMLAGAVVLAVSTLVGSLAGQTGWLFVAIAGAWGFAAGLLASLGQMGSALGLMSAAVVIVVSHIPLPPSQAALVAGVMLAGGLFQTALAVAPWPFQRFRPEREALAKVYRELAAYASEPPGDERVVAALDRAAAALRSDDTDDTGGDEGEILRGLLVEAGRVHLELVRLADVRPALTGDAAARADTLSGAAADALRALAAAIERERAPEGLQEPAERIETALAGLGGDGDLAAAYALARGETLGRELRSAARIAALPEQPHGAARAPLPTPTLAPSPERGKLEILRANLSPHSVNFQHALRLGVALVIGAALYKGLPLGRGYWVPFTVLMVLRPDFATTFTRGLARWAGTAAGVALSTALVAVVPLDARTLTALVVVVTFLSYTVFYVNYALYSVFLTAQVVFLTAFTGTSATTIALDRFVDTALGAALGLAIFLLLPTWERGRLPDTLAGMLAAERSYVAAVTGAYLAPQDYDSRAILQGRLAAWRAISNAQATAQRARLEPGSDRGASDRAQGILDAASRLARALLALDANLERRRDRAPLPVVDDFARAAEATLADLETALRAGQTPSAAGHERDLEVSAEALRRLDARTEASAEPDLAFFVSQADRIADSLATLRHVLATGDEAAS